MSNPSKITEVYEKSTCLFTLAQINIALDQMAAAITEQLQNKNPVVLCVMIGGLVTMGNLLTRLHFPLEVDYLHATRYCGEIVGGHLHWKVKPSIDLRDRVVLIVDDILDGGLTFAAIIAELKAMGAKQVYSAVLVDKCRQRVADGLQKVDFTGLQIDNHYIFGYGMDYKEYLRNAPGIFVVAPEHE